MDKIVLVAFFLALVLGAPYAWPYIVEFLGKFDRCDKCGENEWREVPVEHIPEEMRLPEPPQITMVAAYQRCVCGNTQSFYQNCDWETKDDA
ncbi:MAG: hypothetical protein AAB355_03470 [Patescibacteria group bacterium]